MFLSPSRIALFAGASLLPFQPLSAQETTAETPAPAREHDDDYHGEIVVRAAGLDRLDVLAGTSVVDGDEFQRNIGGQLGEVLAKLPGVSATSFTPGASRPILRGFGGDRVRVLSDGLGSADASSTSSDHAVAIDPLVTERVEVLRGPAVLLYGSQAIGGAVNVIGKRIPLRPVDEPIHVDALVAMDSAADKREIGASIDVPLAPNVAFHVDGSYHETGNLEIPGYVASEHLREQLLASAEEEAEEGHLDEAEEFLESANARGELPNSWTEATSFGTGVAFFSGESSLGVSFGYYDTSYGIPGLHGVGHVHAHDEEGEEDEHDHDHEEAEHEEEGDVTIGLKQYRADLRGVLDLGDGFFDSLQTRWGYSDYTHTEFEGEETGTVFDVSSVEGRVELVQSRRGGWQGSIGGQYYHQDFSALGEEAFVPPNTTEQFALFTVQEFYFDPFELELGGRYEHSDVALVEQGQKRDFDTFSGSLGLAYGLGEEFRVGLNGSRAERAPTAQELFADGPHVATQQYEIGDSGLGIEGAWGLEAYLRGSIGPGVFRLSVYQNWFDDFIYLQDTGLEEDGLAAYRFLQQDADHFGIEGEFKLPLYAEGGWDVEAELRGDYVRATLADGSPVPRIPPLSLSGALDLAKGPWSLRGEVEWFDEQARVASYEEPTDGFTQVNLALGYKPLQGSDNVTILLQADNLFDVEGRRHASFTKEFVPLAGRNVKLSVRTSF